MVGSMEALDGIMGTLEVIPPGESVPMEQNLVNYLPEKKSSLRARYIYGFIFLLMNLLAWSIRDYGQKGHATFSYLKACGTDGKDCYHKEGVLRVSLGCFIFYLFMLLTTLTCSKLYEASNSWHSGWWTAKIFLLIILVGVPFFLPVEFIRVYGEIAHIGAGLFLLLQLVSVIHFITWWNNYWMPDKKMMKSCSLGLFMSKIFVIASICGIIAMYLMYTRGSSCSLNIFFITWTTILIVVMILVSLHSEVNTGLLSSGIMSLYVVYLCWSAIRSEPTVEKCSPQNLPGNGNWTTIVGFIIAICAIVMATFSAGIDSESFKFRKDEAQSPDDTPYKYWFFHFVFSMGTMYFAMLFINWNLEQSTRKWSIDVGWASAWVKIINEWFAVAIFLWTLISPAVHRAKIRDVLEESERNAQDSA